MKYLDRLNDLTDYNEVVRHNRSPGLLDIAKKKLLMFKKNEFATRQVESPHPSSVVLLLACGQAVPGRSYSPVAQGKPAVHRLSYYLFAMECATSRENKDLTPARDRQNRQGVKTAGHAH